MANQYAASILQSLRRIIRSIDQHNKQLGKKYQMTIPQLVCLRQLASQDGQVTTGNLAKQVYLSQATVTGILDRLERKGLIMRQRSTLDRRQVFVSLTEAGIKLNEEMPWPLQERFAQSLASLSSDKQEQFDTMLQHLVEMMEAPQGAMWPYGDRESMPRDAHAGCSSGKDSDGIDTEREEGF
ncbi:MarR family winged helix-turn-helix transcriptional regulator [Desulfoplanes formicivorans]|uniref:MarR family transcriptional regulator n=1 Tax=Desulfoplanes formicivorans TaxID=1592317 RepID=A0A194AHF9_9BACT|nr:MarR family transcriptional regulator [Desulfoplanes formicivorans]GAU08768.1 MarR family transcriptional regulator [Desulfoplanes formicivorans]